MRKSGFHDYLDHWEKLLCSKRIDRDWSFVSTEIKLTPSNREEFRTPFEADVQRIQFSAPFRRLAGKTQVHPFSEVDFIHNRLTHSVEVGSVSRSLARRVGRFICSRGDFTCEAQIDQLGWVAMAGGLGHDIGNPPYGHAGEAAIRAWSKSYRQKQENKDLVDEGTWLDFECFDGNAQAFRMLSRPDLRPSSYFRLTAASLGALVKYPEMVTDVSKSDNPKFNCYNSEKDSFKAVMSELGLYSQELNSFQRHPVSYLTEAADDICYRVSDFEDAVLMGLIPKKEVRSLFLEGLEFSDRCQFENKSLSHIRSKIIGLLIEEFAKCFEEHYDEIMEGSLEQHDLKECVSSKWRGILCRIKEMYKTIFAQRTKIIEEIGCYGQISTVMTLFFDLLHELKGGAKSFEDVSFRSQRIISLAWGEDYFKEHLNKPCEWWAHTILDHVTGMTDSYLNKLASELR